MADRIKRRASDRLRLRNQPKATQPSKAIQLRRSLRTKAEVKRRKGDSDETASGSGRGALPTEEALPLPAVLADNHTEANSHEMLVIVFYGSEEVARCLVTDPHGCRLFYAPVFNGGDILLPITQIEFERLFGDLRRGQIALPPPNSEKNFRDKLPELLKAMGRGLLLDMYGGDVFATMLGQCTVYCSDRRSVTSTAGKLERGERTKVYDFQRLFLPCIRAFTAGIGRCPSSELYFTFGQTWDQERPSEDNLLSIAVVHGPARRIVRECCRMRSDGDVVLEFVEEAGDYEDKSE
eukprot:m.17128 g.17128  ORF g.17128 m.17128 type:complete len:294 (+) comp27332_c1_seq4:307-1188(+)